LFYDLSREKESILMVEDDRSGEWARPTGGLLPVGKDLANQVEDALLDRTAGMILARDIFEELGYLKWSNFLGVVRRANQLISNGLSKGTIKETTRRVQIGSGAYRKIIDYELDSDAADTVKIMASSFKLNGHFFGRNETAILHLLGKWASARGLTVEPQAKIDGYVYDVIIADTIIVEFDEPHHQGSRQTKIDRAKSDVAKNNNKVILRFGIECDIIDVISEVESALFSGFCSGQMGADVAFHWEKPDFVAFQTEGYKGLYGGLDVAGIRRRKGLNARHQILDHMGSTELAANLFRATQTEEKLRREGVQGKTAANRTHYLVGQKVRQTIREIGGDMPETLPPAEDIKKVGRRLAKPKRGNGDLLEG
jgi:very-short-patch-repair endonuclease